MATKKIKVLSESDLALMRSVVNTVRQQLGNATGRGKVDLDDIPAPEVYVCRTPVGGIDGMSGLSPGFANCDIYRIIPVDGSTPILQTVSNYSKRVYNISEDAIEGEQLVLINRDKYGYWIALSVVGGGSVGTGTGDNVERTIIDDIDVDGCRVVARKREIQFPSGQLLSSQTIYLPICEPQVHKVPQRFELIGSIVYVEYWDIEYPSGNVVRKYCEPSAPTSCASGSGSFTGCISGCYMVFINAFNAVCEDCYDGLSHLIELTDNGDCTLQASVTTCNNERLITVEDNGTQLTITITDLASGDLIARYAIDDGLWDPIGLTVLQLEYGDSSCIWPQYAFIEPCMSGTGAGTGIDISWCACSGGYTGTGTGTSIASQEDTARFWRVKFENDAPISFGCSCVPLGCTYCLECSHDNSGAPYYVPGNTPGAIYGGDDGLHNNQDEPDPGVCSRCLWSDWVRRREGGTDFTDCVHHAPDFEDYLVVLRGNSDFWTLTVERYGDPTDIIVRYSNVPPTSCTEPYDMYLNDANRVDCKEWPLRISLYPSNDGCVDAGTCAETCAAVTAYDVNFGGVTGTLSELEYEVHVPPATAPGTFTPCPTTVDCAETYGSDIRLCGGPCKWEKELIPGIVCLPEDGDCVDCNVPPPTVIMEDKGDKWTLYIWRPYPTGVHVGPGEGLRQVVYEADKPADCDDNIIFELVQVNDQKCNDWPCLVIARPVPPFACCPDRTCDIPSMTSLNLSITNTTLIDCPCLDVDTTMDLQGIAEDGTYTWLSKEIPCVDKILQVKLTCGPLGVDCGSLGIQILCDGVTDSAYFVIDSCDCSPFSVVAHGAILPTACPGGLFPADRCEVGAGLSLTITEP